MSLIKRRPEILLYKPGAVHARGDFVLRVCLRCGEAVPTKAIDVELRGSYAWIGGDQVGTPTGEGVFLRQRARVGKGGELAAGEHSFSAAFRLPAGLPGSYDGQELQIRYVVDVHVDIPWWPDARARFVLQVMSPSQPSPLAGQKVFASAAGGPTGAAPYLEVSLGATQIESGGTLRGAVALANTATNNYQELEIGLVAVERVGSLGIRYAHHRQVRNWRVPIVELGEGEPTRFSLELPEGLTPAFDLRACSLQWFLELRATVARLRKGPQAWIPLTVRGPRSGDLQEVRAPLAVGSERQRLVWQRVAQARGLELGGDRLHGRYGEISLAVERAERGRTGTILCGTLKLPELGIGLRCKDGSWVSRDPAQSTWLMGQLGELPQGLRLAEADDRKLSVELDNAGVDLRVLLAFVDALLGLVKRLEPALLRIPPPAAMAGMVPAWGRAAQTLGAEFSAGAMRLRGAREGLAFSLWPAWDESGSPSQTILELVPGTSIDGRHHLTWRAGEPQPESSLPLEPLYADARALEISAARVRVVLGGPLEDPHTELDRVAALIAVGRRLMGRVGVYR